MDINKPQIATICFILCTVISLTSISYSWATDQSTLDQQAWVKEEGSYVCMNYLESDVTVTIKNNNNHAQYFKISQVYNQTTPPILWRVVSTNPSAVKMIKFQSDVDNYDLGWEVGAGQTKTVSFKLVAYPVPSSVLPAYISRNASLSGAFWPILNEPGLTATWFVPNEIEYLDPSLDLVSANYHFCFWIQNYYSTGPKVQGIVRAPIVPIDSNLTYSNPKVSYVDKELPWANTAAWDVTLYPGQSKHYAYTYQWPSGSKSSASGSAGSATYNVPTTAAATTNATVPTSKTGVPFALFVVAAIIIAGGVTYAKFFRKGN